MSKNLFEELQDKKQTLALKAKKATEYGWITPKQQSDILDKLEKDVLTIGVIGQMKCGKSTFLNAFVFEEDVLPSATTPMTAALSVITYGEKEKIVAEFFTKEEWSEMELTASRALENVEGNVKEEGKIKAAKEITQKGYKSLGNTLESYLGNTQEDVFSNLIEYVGADGKFVPITKSVTIYYPKEYLKGVEIVDTPGFNDPIVSREERTKVFLNKADVVLMMLYAGRLFDATDRDILFRDVRNCGIGKVILAINKYDIPYCDRNKPETEDRIIDYVKEEIRKACKICEDDSLTEILKQADPIALSAEMALLSELPMSRILSRKVYKDSWDRLCGGFEISNQTQMRKRSHLDELTSAIKNMVENEKEKILFAKPVNAIMAAGKKRESDIESSLQENKELIDNLCRPDEELEERQNNLERTMRRLNKKIDSLGYDMDEALNSIVTEGKDELVDEVDRACKMMKQRVDREFKMFTHADNIVSRINEILQQLYTRDMKRCVEQLERKAKKKIVDSVRSFMEEVNELFMKYITDYDLRDRIKSIEHQLNFDIEDKELFSFDSSDGEEEGFWDYVGIFLNGATYGIFKRFGNALTHNDEKQSLYDQINSIQNEFDPLPYLESIYKRKDEIIDSIKSSFIDEELEPLRKQIEDIRAETGSREDKLAEAKMKVEQLTKQREEIARQLIEIES